MDGVQIITAPGLATLMLEGLKVLLRSKFLFGKEFDFPTVFYGIMIPIMTFLAKPILALIEIADYSFPTDLESWLKELVVVILSSLFTVLIYNDGVKPLKEYYAERYAERINGS